MGRLSHTKHFGTVDGTPAYINYEDNGWRVYSTSNGEPMNERKFKSITAMHRAGLMFKTNKTNKTTTNNETNTTKNTEKVWPTATEVA